MTIVYPGSFDPPTIAHIALIERAARLFDRVVVLVMQNPSKDKRRDLSVRAELLRRCTASIPRVTVDCGHGLLLAEARRLGAKAILRGIRSEADYQAEKPVADAFLTLYGLDTIFLPGEPGHAFISARMARELLALGGDARALIPEVIADRVIDLYDNKA